MGGAVGCRVDATAAIAAPLHFAPYPVYGHTLRSASNATRPTPLPARRQAKAQGRGLLDANGQPVQNNMAAMMAQMGNLRSMLTSASSNIRWLPNLLGGRSLVRL